MRGDPEDGPALQRECAAHGQEVLEPLVGLETPMRVQPVVAHADAQAHGHADGDSD